MIEQVPPPDSPFRRLRQKQTNTNCSGHALNALLNKLPGVNSSVLFAAELIVTLAECRNDVDTTMTELAYAAARIKQSGFRLDSLAFILRLVQVEHSIVYQALDIVNSVHADDPKQWLNLPNEGAVIDLEGAILHCGSHFTFIEFIDGAGWAHYDWFEEGPTPLKDQFAFYSKFVGCHAIVLVPKIKHNIEALIAQLRTQSGEFIQQTSEMVGNFKLVSSATRTGSTPGSSALSSKSAAAAASSSSKTTGSSQASKPAGRNTTYSSDLRVCQNHIESVRRQLTSLSSQHAVHFSLSLYRPELGVCSYASHPSLDLRTFFL